MHHPLAGSASQTHIPPVPRPSMALTSLPENMDSSVCAELQALEITERRTRIRDPEARAGVYPGRPLFTPKPDFDLNTHRCFADSCLLFTDQRKRFNLTEAIMKGSPFLLYFFMLYLEKATLFETMWGEN